MKKHNVHSVVSIKGDDTLEVKEQKYQKAMEEHPEMKDEFLCALSNAHLMEHKLDKALAYIQEAIACAPADSENLGDYYGWLSLIYSWMENEPAALEAKEKSVQLEPDEAEGKMQLGQLYEEQKDYKKAVAMFEQAFINPGDDYRDIDWSPFYNYINTYFDKEEDRPSAKKIFNKLLKASETDGQRAAMYCALSFMNERLENYSLAIDNARRATELLPAEFQTTIRFAESFAAASQHKEAIEVYDRLPAIAETSLIKVTILHWYFNKTGELYLSMNKFKEAVECYEKDLPLWDNVHRTYDTLKQLSAIHYQQRQYALAKPYLQRIIEQWPDVFPRAYSSMAMYYMEEVEDMENALNYLFKAAQVNHQSPENPEGSETGVAASVNALIGMVYYRKLKNEEAAIPYYETALLCHPDKGVEAEICTALYEIYKKTGNEERAAELKDKRTGPVMLLDMFNGPLPPRPGLQARLGKPKNEPGEIEKLPYYYKNLPKKSTDEFSFMRQLMEEFYDDMTTNTDYKEYFSKYYPFEVKKFCFEYAKHKESLISTAKWVMDPDETNKEKSLRFYTDRIFELVLQKKLWNLQLQWRAENIEIPGVEIAYDFEMWSYNIRKCQFIEVTVEDVEVMKQFLLEDDFNDNIPWLVGWQEYNKLMHQNEEDAFDSFPPWYIYYDDKMGTGVLIDMPDIRGEKEKEYIDAYYKWKHKQPPDPVIPPPPPRPQVLQYLVPTEDEFTKFIEKFENDYICRLHQERLNSRIYPDKEYDEDAVREAIMDLEKAEIPIYLESGLVWHKAIVKAAQKYKNSQMADYLDTVFATYNMQRELNLNITDEFEELHDDTYWTIRRNEIAEKILKGREVMSEPRDFNF